MRLRARLAVTLLAAAVPSLAALLALDAATRHQAAQERLLGFVSAHLDDDELRERCERAEGPAALSLSKSRRPPPRPHGPPDERRPPRPHGPPPEGGRPATLTAYDEQGQHPSRPALEPEWTARARATGNAPEPWRLGEQSVRVLVHTGWGGACSYMLGEGESRPEWGAVLPRSPMWLLPVLASSVAVLFSMGLLVRRLRRLITAVDRASADDASDGPPQQPLFPREGSDEITELACAFERATRRIGVELSEKRRSEQALREFLTNTTHDVMIPLTVLQGHLTTLREASHDGTTVDAEVIGAAMDEAQYLGALLHNLALVSKLDAAEPTMVRVELELTALVERVVARHRPVAQARGISLDFSLPAAPMHLQADPTLLEQAVSNLVHNAVRYNRPDGHVAVLLESIAAEPGPERFRLSVIDDGPGIPTAERERLLQRGARGDQARTRAPEGQGLGLYIARRAAEVHELTLTLTDSEYGGTLALVEGALTAPS